MKFAKITFFIKKKNSSSYFIQTLKSSQEILILNKVLAKKIQQKKS